jgi:hypothetical protein
VSTREFRGILKTGTSSRANRPALGRSPCRSIPAWDKSIVPNVGLEPTRPCGDRILSPVRLPECHGGIILSSPDLGSFLEGGDHDRLDRRTNQRFEARIPCPRGCQVVELENYAFGHSAMPMHNTNGSPVPQLTPGQPRQMLGEAINHLRRTSMTGTLLNCDEAVRFIEQIQDPVTKNLVNMAFVHLVKRVHLEKRDLPATGLDMLFLVTSLKDFFAEHDVIARTLEGEKVGAWFDGM